MKKLVANDHDGNRITNVGDPVDSQDVETKASVEGKMDFLGSTLLGLIEARVDTNGDTMTGVLNMGSNRIVEVSDPINAQDAATKAYADTMLDKANYDPSVINEQVLGISAVQTVTNKRITKRTGTVASSATPTINTDNVDFYSLTAQAEDITSFTTNLSGTPTEGQTLWIAITGTASRSITWGSGFESSTVSLPTTTSGTSRLDVGFVWNSATSKWRVVAVA